MTDNPDSELQWPADALAPTDVTRARQAPVAMTACFWILEQAALPELRAVAVPAKNWLGRSKDGFSDFLRAHARRGPTYTGTGRALSALLGFLQKRGIELQPPEYRELAAYIGAARGGTAFILNGRQGRPHLEILNPFLFLESELRAHYNEAHDSSDLQSGKAMLDGVVAFRDCLRSLAPDSVALLIIG